MIESTSAAKLFFIISAVPFILQLIIIWMWNMQAAGDIEVYITNAIELGKSGKILSYTDYSLRFPHLFWMGVILSPICKIGVSYKVFQILFAIVTSVTSWLLYCALKNILNKRIAVLTMLLYVYMPSTLFSCMTITHEIVFRYGFILLMWLLSKIKVFDAQVDLQKIALQNVFRWGLVGLLISLCARINQMAVILLIALLIVVILSKKYNGFHKFLIMVLLLFPIFVGGYIATPIQQTRTASKHLVAQRAYAWAFLLEEMSKKKEDITSWTSN